MFESLIERQRNFSSCSVGNKASFPSLFNQSTQSNQFTDCKASLTQNICVSYQTRQTADMPLDTETLYSLIARQRAQSLEDRSISAYFKSKLEAPNGRTAGEDAGFIATRDSRNCGNRPILAAKVLPTTLGNSSRTPVFLPSQVEQLNPSLESHLSAMLALPTAQQSEPNLSCSLNGESASENLSLELEDQLPLKVSQRKHSMDFLSGIVSAFEPSNNEDKKLMTLTERIQVPSSDHVAEIVGKNGLRIKHLREQLKVWVKTPSRDELPIFEITGLPDKLIEAKRIILQMSDHFTKVQQERLSRIEPNRVEDRLYVEQDKVGLIVGASGQTIRWVQQLSDTHIATPRKQESIPGLPPLQTYFTICGTRERVRFAKQLICEYVNLRCQGLWLDSDLETSPEAARLVREFHQRRQVEDTQRRGSAPAATIAQLSGGGLGGGGTAGETSASPSSLAEVKRLWQEGGPPTSVWDSVLFNCVPPNSAPPLPPLQQQQQQQQQQQPLSLLADRRYSVDAPSVAQHHHQRQLQQQQQPAFGPGNFDPLSKKSFSDDLVAQVGLNGWM